jgi:thymidylate kinase
MNKKNLCICVSGLDGTGKSYIVKELIKHYKKENDTKHVWSRYKNYTSKPLLFFTRLIGLNYKENYNGIIIGYHDFYKSKLISFFFLFFQWIDQIIEIFIKFKLTKKNIISDRSIIDTLVDLSIDTKLEKIIFGFYGKSLIKFMPKNTIFLIIKRDLEKIRKNREDVFYDKNLKKRLELFNQIAEFFPVYALENNSKIDFAINKIISIVNQK